jgi:hypothetical protein
VDEGAFEQKRETDSEFVQVVRAADTGISIGWKWIQIATTIASAFFVAGVAWAGFNSMKDQIRDLSAGLTELRRNGEAVNRQQAIDRRDLDHALSEIGRLDRDQAALRGEVGAVRGEQSEINKMREAYEVSRARRQAAASTP